MAGREFTVKARIVSDTKDAERNIRALSAANDELSKKLTDLRAKFDAGEISATKFARAQAGIEREAARVSRTLSGITPEVEKATTAFEKQTKTLLGFGSAVAVLATVKRAISAIAGASEESQANFDALSNQISGVLTPAANSLSTVFGAFASTIRTVRDDSAGLSSALSAIGTSITETIPLVGTLVSKFGELAEQERLTREAEEGIAATRRKMEEATRAAAKAANEEAARNQKFQEDVVAALEKEAGAQFKANAEKEKAAEKAKTLALANQEVAAATDDFAESTVQASQVAQQSIVVMQGQAQQALLTAAAFRALAQSQGRGAAVSAAVSAGGSLSSSGRRVTISGGSRLTSSPGLTGFVGRNR